MSVSRDVRTARVVRVLNLLRVLRPAERTALIKFILATYKVRV